MSAARSRKSQSHPAAPGRRQEAENELVLSYLAVRRAIGLLGFALPTLLLAIAAVSGDGIRPSISEYYYSVSGNIFVGVMAAIGVFLWSYVGYDAADRRWPTDRMVSRTAAVAAFGVALIPTANKLVFDPPREWPCTFAQCLLDPAVAQKLHYASAAVFFGALAVASLVLFRRTKPGDDLTGNDPETRAKRARNRIYAVCGWLILGCMALLAAFSVWYNMTDPAARAAIDRFAIVFWLETVAVLAFATSWLVKGESLKPLEKLTRKMMSDTPGPGAAR